MLRHSAEFRIVENLIQSVQSFLELAGMEAADGNALIAAKLVTEAEHSIGVITELLAALPEEFARDRTRLELQTESLGHALRKINSSIHPCGMNDPHPT